MSRKRDGIKGQITFDEYLKSKRKMFPTCDDCVCQACLYWWSYRCPYGKCYDDHRAQVAPYDEAHPDKPPRTYWSDWEEEQAYWCRGGEIFPVSYCEHFVKYKGQQVKHCLRALVSIFQDGYMYCSIVGIQGCQWCYEWFEERMQRENERRKENE